MYTIHSGTNLQKSRGVRFATVQEGGKDRGTWLNDHDYLFKEDSHLPMLSMLLMGNLPEFIEGGVLWLFEVWRETSF